jgi:hypothetical protein
MHKIAIIRKDAKIAESTQVEAARFWGVTDEDMWFVERPDHDIKNLIVRKGDAVGIYRLDLLASRGKKAKLLARQSLKNHVTDFLRVGATIHELSTGRSCSDKAELIEMYDEARDRFLSDFKTGNASGRPPVHVYDAKERDHIEIIWNDRRHKNNTARVVAVREHYPAFNEAVWYAQFKKEQGIE